ncbi:hypothetical protein [Roseivirga pacifica]|uniref:hypothetical protein n=1 Tax=Roseivirga pacifica TaxID=1267423 RepID=UPI0020955AC1|nr:hypothetical protein [Roseivirga pacifica]MCO6360765.1 hypothetical protein [Roseivirga pacifica]MCO6368654.1 hypothetical protein [Roseivirga pacifica]MCO6372797.1 hypothetical protein [Roseivirga pacifica]MCO6376856.1 hypothetical protein [Roseivirga pacifica]MCO6377866.1 hypothetical protein [Roseivirga pacifica]
MSGESNMPHDEPKLYWFSQLLRIGKWPVFKELGLLISLIFIRVAPEIPISLKKSYSGPDGKKAALIGFCTTFIFAFLINILGAYFNDTLAGSTFLAGNKVFNGDGEVVIYFIDDWWNVLLYSVICPAYVGLTCWLVVIVIKGYGEIKDFKQQEIEAIHTPKRFKLIKSMALGILILSVAFLLTTNYINDIMKLVDKGRYYWFLSNINGEYQVRALGVYYFLLNFSLLIVTLLALTFFMSIYSLIMSVGKALESKREIGKLEFKILKEKLSMFTEAYIITKGIIACYIANIWIWADSPLGKGVTENFAIAVILLTIIGAFLVSFPRYFVELQWYKLKLRVPEKLELDTTYEDLRTFRIKNIAHVLDYLFIGGFLIYAIKYVVGL